MKRALALLLLVVVLEAQAIPGLSGSWRLERAGSTSGLLLREVADGLEVNGRLYSLNKSESGVHPGSSDRYQTTLTRLPHGYHLHTVTVVARMGQDRLITTRLLTVEVDYRLSDDGMFLLESVTTHSSPAESGDDRKIENRYLRR